MRNNSGVQKCTSFSDFDETWKNNESEDKFVDGTYHSDENLLNNISTLNKHGA